MFILNYFLIYMKIILYFIDLELHFYTYIQ